MRRSLMVRWPIPWNMEGAAKKIAGHLRGSGFEVDEARKNYRVLRFKKNYAEWTLAYTGLTHKAKSTRNGLRIVGPEADFIPEYAFYQGGIFAGQYEESA